MYTMCFDTQTLNLRGSGWDNTMVYRYKCSWKYAIVTNCTPIATIPPNIQNFVSINDILCRIQLIFIIIILKYI